MRVGAVDHGEVDRYSAAFFLGHTLIWERDIRLKTWILFV